MDICCQHEWLTAPRSGAYCITSCLEWAPPKLQTALNTLLQRYLQLVSWPRTGFGEFYFRSNGFLKIQENVAGYLVGVRFLHWMLKLFLSLTLSFEWYLFKVKMMAWKFSDNGIIWHTSRENRLCLCHTKRRMGAHGRTHPFFGMTPTFQNLPLLTS